MNISVYYFGQTLVLASPVPGRDGCLAVPVRGWLGNGRAWCRAVTTTNQE